MWYTVGKAGYLLKRVSGKAVKRHMATKDTRQQTGKQWYEHPTLIVGLGLVLFLVIAAMINRKISTQNGGTVTPVSMVLPLSDTTGLSTFSYNNVSDSNNPVTNITNNPGTPVTPIGPPIVPPRQIHPTSSPTTKGSTVTVEAWPNHLSTLWGIAANSYGNGALWPAIYQANKQKIGSNPDLLYAGTQLYIPSKSSLSSLN